jgi:cytochrome P450
MDAIPVCGFRDTLAFLKDPAAFTAGPGLQRGDFYRLRLPGRRLFVVTDPMVVESILVSQAEHFEKSRIYWRELRRSMGESLGTLEGERWEYLHDAQRPFFTPEATRSYLPAVNEQTRLHFRRLARASDAPAETALLESFAELSARIVLAALFGQDREPLAREAARRIADGHAIVAWRDKFPWRPLLGWLNGVNRRVGRHREWLDAYAAGLRRSAAATDPRRLLHALTRVEADPIAPEFGASLLRNEVAFHLGAGTETLATATGWTVYLLWKHPEVLRRLRAEIAVVASRSPVSMSHVESLGYVKQVVQEALRLFPPVYAVLRDCVRPAHLGGHAIRRGDTLLISIHGIHRNPSLWAEPDHFRPERFQESPIAATLKYRYLPFGAGRHVCIGRHLALSSMVLTVAHFAQQFDWTFQDPDIRPVATPSLKPSGPFLARLTARPSAPALAG